MNDYTRAMLRARLRETVGPAEGAQASAFWSDEALDDALSESLRTWNRLTGCWAGRVVIPTTAGQGFITVPNTTLGWTARVFWGDKPLTPTSLFALDQIHAGWQGVAADASRPPKRWAPVALNLFVVQPVPPTSDRTLVVDGVLATPVLTATNTIRLDEEIVPIVVAYARHLALFSLGVDPWRASLTARSDLWRAAGERNARLRASDPYKRVLGLHEQGWVKAKRSGSEEALGVKAPAEEVA